MWARARKKSEQKRESRLRKPQMLASKVANRQSARPLGSFSAGPLIVSCRLFVDQVSEMSTAIEIGF